MGDRVRMLTPGLLVVLVVGLGGTAWSQATSQSASPILERTDDGLLVRYLDVNGEWLELKIPDAGRLFVQVQSTFELYRNGTWLYNYSVTNELRSSRAVVHWSVPVEVGTEIFFAPPGWQGTKADQQFMVPVDWSAVEGPPLAPSLSMSGWTLVSTALPGIVTARFRALSLVAADNPDMPERVRERILALDRDSGASHDVIAPLIPTRYPTALGDIVAEPTDILARAYLKYRPVLDRYRRWIDPGVLEHFYQARKALERKDRMAAREILQGASKSLKQHRIDDASIETIRVALLTVIDYVTGQLA